MNFIYASKSIKSVYIYFLSLTLTLLSTSVNAEINRIAVTQDNDIFVGNDSGYSNGLYISFLDTSDTYDDMPSEDFWVAPLMWSMPKSNIQGTVNSYMLGQTMNTPSDITIAEPDVAELPYSALLALTNTYIVINSNYADSVATTIGIVGPAALGEQAQTLVHKAIGSSEPEGWDTQLENEIVFRFSRARVWRTWAAQSDTIDFLTNTSASLGTIRSSVNTGMTLRYGKNLLNSYATKLFSSSRTSNPAAVNNGWFIYTGIEAGYIFNQIFTDGNTFRDSNSIDYDNEYIEVSAGVAYSYNTFSVTYAVNDSNILSRENTIKTQQNLTRYGTLTLSWEL